MVRPLFPPRRPHHPQAAGPIPRKWSKFRGAAGRYVKKSPGRLQEGTVPPGKDRRRSSSAQEPHRGARGRRSRPRTDVLSAGGVFMAAHLRVFPTTREAALAPDQEPEVRVSLGELLPLVALAHRK